LHDLRQEWALYYVAPDGSKRGAPVIRVDANAPRPEAEIAHELLHLQLLARFGFRRVVLQTEGTPLPGTSEQEYAIVEFILSDALDHIVMFPKLREMDFHPEKENRDSLGKALALHGRPNWDNKSTVTRAVMYAGLTTEIQDRVVLKQLEDSMEKAGWNDALRLGRELRVSMERADLTTLEGKGNEEVKDFKILYGSKLQMRWQYAPVP
jgi:hypothetical protein